MEVSMETLGDKYIKEYEKKIKEYNEFEGVEKTPSYGRQFKLGKTKNMERPILNMPSETTELLFATRQGVELLEQIRDLLKKK
jgi:hypothetical protein